MNIINDLIQYWLDATWYIALLLSILVNISIFMITASFLEKIIQVLIYDYNVGSYINNKPLKPNQKKHEIKNGIVACIIFALGSLLIRLLYQEIWPTSFIDLCIQVLVFTVYYESYSYLIHRILHSKYLIKFHAIHHRSLRVTSWTAYSVHPIEAAFIGLSVPLYMFFLPLNLGTSLVFHVFGMMFTIIIHSNYKVHSSNTLLRNISNYPLFHSKHHSSRNVNFGFIHGFWDKLFKTINRD